MLLIQIVIPAIEILLIIFMIWENAQWQERVRRDAGIVNKPKIKLKKGQSIQFSAEEDISPF